MGRHDPQTAPSTVIAAEAADDHIALHWQGGGVSRFHYQWLRDNCRSLHRFNHTTGERRALTETIPADLRAGSISLEDGGVHLSWSDGESESTFDPAWLRRHAYDSETAPAPPARVDWGAEYGRSLRTFSYRAVLRDDATAARMIEWFERYGLVRMTGAPVRDGEVERFASRLAYVREIAFDRVADIRVRVDPYTLGFTNAALPLHTDCSGYSWPPNVMVFHCLANEVAGGTSHYVDGARVVADLKRAAPDALRILTDYAVEFRLWSSKADTLVRVPPVILDAAGDLAILRYANWTLQPLRHVPFDVVPRWYAAWRALADRINAPENRVAYRCQPGDLLLINNHRVLHGRDAFEAGEGLRHFQQVYMELDDLSGFRRMAQGHGGMQ